MSIDWQTISLPFIGGIDSKSDEKSLPPTKLALLENGVFTKRGSIRKRNGYVALGHETLTGAAVAGARSVAVRDDELVLFTGDRVYSYAEASDAWLDRGPLVSVVTSQETAAKTRSNQTSADRATSQGVTLYAWEDSRGTVRYSLIDEESGAVYVHDQDLGAGTTRPRCVVSGGYLHLLHVHTPSGELRTKRISPSNIAAGVTAAPLLVAADIASPYHYDTTATTARALVAYKRTGGYAVLYLQPSGAVSSKVTRSSTDANTVACAVMADGRVVVVHDNGPSLAEVLFAVFGPDLTVWSSEDPAAGAGTVASISVAAEDADTVRIAWTETSAAPGNFRSYSVGVDLPTNALTAVAVLRRSALASRLFTYGGIAYAHVVFRSTLQTSYLTVRVSDWCIVARRLAGTGNDTLPSVLPQVEHLGGGRYAWAGIYRERLDATGTNAVFAERGIKRLGLDFEHPQSHRAVQLGGSLYVSGGILWQYDGQTAHEAGFLLYPEGVTAASSSDTGDLVAAKAYTYRVYWEWTNARGERELSSTSAAVSITVGGGHNTVTLTIPTLAHTMKAGISLAIYRTEADPTDDAPFYRVSNLDPTATGANGYATNNPAADTVTFVDKLADATLITRELDYQNTGELDNIAPSSAHVLAAGKDRLWLAGGDTPHQIQASKLVYPGEPVAFNDALLIEVDQDGGPITGLALINETLIVFKQRSIFALGGDGPDNLGSGPFQRPTLITADVGCVNQRSIVRVPAGLMFQSEKGIYLLGQGGYQVQYIGAEAEAYNGQTITAATLLADTNQVRFLTDAGQTLLFDYLFSQWGTFTGHEGTDARVWRGVYCYVANGGKVRKESPGVYRDEHVAYRLRMETAWIKLQGLQGFQRVRRAHVLGEFASTHRLRMHIGYDYHDLLHVLEWDPGAVLTRPSYGESTPYGTGPFGGEGETVYQWRASMPRQKCQAIKFRLEDIPGSPPGESYQISDLTLEVGIKQGAGRLPAAKSG